MAIIRETSDWIRDVLKDHPEGMSITDIVRAIPINRNTASRYLDTLLVTGQVEMHRFGMAKIYTLSKRLPVSSVLSVSSEFVLQIDRNMRIVFINTPFLDLLGFAERDVLGKKIDLTPVIEVFGDEGSRLLRWISEGLSGVARQGEIKLPARDHILVCRVTPSVFLEGQKGVSVLFEDITAHRKSEDCLRESEEKFRTLAEVATDGIMICNADGMILEWNEAMTRITGLSGEQVKGKKLQETIPEYLRPDTDPVVSTARIKASLRNAIGPRSSRHFLSPNETEILRPDGERRFLQRTIFPIRTRGQTLIGAIVHDITERRKMLEEISAREERFRALFDNAADMITVHAITPEGLPGTFVEVNDLACRRLGYTREELLSMSPQDIDDPSCLDVMQNNSKKLVAEGSAVFEIVHVAKNGRKIPVEVRARIFEFHATPLVISQVRDLTDLKAAEAAIRESETRLRLALSGSETGLWELDLTTMSGEIDERSAQILGYDVKDIGSRKTDWDALSHPDDVPRIAQSLADYLEGRTATFESEHRMRHASGKWIWITGRGRITRRLADGSPERISGTLQDITRRKQPELALRASEERYRHLLERSFNAVIIHKAGKIVVANEAAQALAGATSARELIGASLTRFVHPDSRQLVQERIALMHEAPGTVMPLIREKFLRLNGEPFEVDVMATSFRDEGIPAIQVVFREVPEACREDPDR